MGTRDSDTVSISEKVNIFYLQPFSKTTNKASIKKKQKKNIHQTANILALRLGPFFFLSCIFSLLFIVRRSSKIDFAVFVALHF